jgi:hypothetical protein
MIPLVANDPDSETGYYGAPVPALGLDCEKLESRKLAWHAGSHTTLFTPRVVIVAWYTIHVDYGASLGKKPLRNTAHLITDQFCKMRSL